MKDDPCPSLSVCMCFKSPSWFPARVASYSGTGVTGQDVQLFTNMKSQDNLKRGYQMNKKQFKYKVTV